MINFKKWLKNEEMTSTSCVANFQNRLFNVTRGDWWLSDNDRKNNRKKNRKIKFSYRVPQIKD